MHDREAVALSDEIKGQALEVGFDLVGIAPAAPAPHFTAYLEWMEKGYHGEMEYLVRHARLREGVGQVLPGARSVVAVGLNYNQPLPAQLPAKVARYALGRDYHKVVRKGLATVGKWLEERLPDARWRVCVDSAPVLERDYAQLAGLGWFGKNTCLINSQRGSWFFLGLLITTAELVPDEPAQGGCGTCRLCLDACPTGALVLREDAPIAWLDARRCISYLTIEKRTAFTEEEKDLLHGWLFGCDVCQEVCPFNHARQRQPLRARTTSVPDFEPREATTAFHLAELAQIPEEEFRKRYAGTAWMRAGAAGIRRNAQALLETTRRTK
ncbi:MAG: epoxyqueuosine reductase [Fimbriimonadales bacterium]|nr:MAG: epoxyqueuosine reductase [Fimbriimonadales bacterium]